jgi:dCMP deaminase
MNKLKTYFVNVLREVSKLSTCASKQVGCIVIRENRIVATGYNGVPSGHDHCNTLFATTFDRDEHHEWAHENELHAEQNAVAFCAKNGISMRDCTVLVSISPCIHCAKLLINTGVKKVVYIEKYDKCVSGIDMLNKSNIVCCPIEEVEF